MLGDGIARLHSVNTFLENYIREAREVSDFQGEPSGPNGTVSLQTMSDIQRLLNSLIELNATVTEENPAFLPEVDLHSLLTLLVENLFAKMRGGSTDTPQVLDFARRFSSSSRERMKRLSKYRFNYFTSAKSYYSRPHCAISFKDLPQMPKLGKNKLPAATMAQMREWRQQYGKSVRQQSVCNMSTKDRTGTLPVNAYEDETVNTEMFDFSVLQRDGLPCSSGQTTLRSVRGAKMLKPWICLAS